MREKLIELYSEVEQMRNMRMGISECVDLLIANGVTIPVRCKECKHWIHMEDGMGDCTNGRFHLDGCANPTMKMDDFCSCGERKYNG